MTTNLRLSLTILSIGFGIEGVGELYSFVSGGSYRLGANLLFVLPSIMTLVGLLFVFVGRHEWNELHRTRVIHAHRAFGVSLLGGLVAGAVVGVLYSVPSLGVPVWAEVVFGAAVGSLVLATFVTYVLLVFHLVPRPSQIVLAGAIAWALAVSVLIGSVFATSLPDLMALVASRNVGIPQFVAPAATFASYLFVAYFLLLAAYVDAHRTVARGPPPPSLATPPSLTPWPGPPPGAAP